MGSPGRGVLTILMTAPDAGVGERVIRRLLEEGLIACGNMVPGAVSLYRWEGEVRRDEEVFIVLKSVERNTPRLLERAAELHPYDVPELLVLPVVGGASEYLEWVEKECRVTGDPSSAAGDSDGEAASAKAEGPR